MFLSLSLLDFLCNVQRLMDSNVGPLSELGRQRRRLRLFVGLADQLKTRESKTVVSIIVMAKSKLIKKWKEIDLR